MPPESAEVQRWLQKAMRDWSVARKALGPPGGEPDLAAFHCQQAVEKTLKAYLVAHAIQFEKVHDLGRLLRLCATVDSALLELLDTVEPLTTFAVAFRYPGPADPTPAKVEAALVVVAQVWRFVGDRLPPAIVPPLDWQ